MANAWTASRKRFGIGPFTFTISRVDVLAVTGTPLMLVLLFGIALPTDFTFSPRALANFWTGGPARSELLAIWPELNLGMTDAEVKAVVRGHNPEDLRVFSCASPNTAFDRTLCLHSPYQFGASNWRGYIQLRDDRVVGLRIRLADEISYHPGDAPPDRAEEDVPPPNYADLKRR